MKLLRFLRLGDSGVSERLVFGSFIVHFQTDVINVRFTVEKISRVSSVDKTRLTFKALFRLQSQPKMSGRFQNSTVSTRNTSPPPGNVVLLLCLSTVLMILVAINIAWVEGGTLKTSQ